MEYHVSSGEISTGIILKYDSMYISSGGVASNTTVNSCGYMHISRGGVASNTTVNSCGYMHISSGGVASNTTVNSYGYMYISSGGVANSTTVNSNGSMHISRGGVASNTTVSNGRMYISSGGVASNTTVNSYGYMYISSGGVANSTTVDGGYMYVYSESVANSTIINSFGRMTISTGGTASDVHVSSGGVLILKEGAKAGDITVDRAATLYLGDNVTAVGDITVGGVMKSHLMYWYQTLDMAGFTFTFDLRNRYITDGYIVQDISDILNADFAITVSEQQASGTYILASNASDFDSVITINRGTASEEIALGETITIGSTQYSLSYAPQSSTLALTVTTPGGGVIPDRPEYIPGTWSTDWEQALEYAVQTDKLVFCVAGDPSYCSFADYMYKQLLQAEDFINFSKENLILVYNDFPADFTYRGTPTVGIFNADGYELYRKSGFGNGYHDIWMNWLNFVVNPSPGVYTDSGSKLVNRGLSASSVFVVSTCNVIAAELSDSWVSEGTLYVTSGGIVNNIVVKSNGTLNVNDGVANSTTVSHGRMFIRDGGVANNTVNYTGMYISSGGVANSTTVSNGVMYIFEGGVANNTVNYEEMNISSGGVASNTTVSNGFMYISSGGVASNTAVSNGRMYISSGGVANSTVNYDEMYISRGGVASNTTVNSNGFMYISSGGVANSTTVNSNGSMYISRGGVANNIIANSGSYIYIESGGAVTNLDISSGVDFTMTVAPDTYIQGISAGSVFEMKNAFISGYTVNKGDRMIITSGCAVNTTVSNGMMGIHNGGIASNTTVNNSSGYMVIEDGAVAKNTTLNKSGIMFVTSGGVANSTTVNSNGRMYISSGGVASNTTVNSNGRMHISSDGVANSTTVNCNGFMYISSGGVASDINVNFLGHALFDGGATLRGSNSFGGNVFITNGTVNAAEATLNFAVEQMNPYDVIIYDLSLIIGDPTYTITVSARLEVGTYMLAQGASSFTGTISIGDSTSNYGSLTVNGEDLVYGGKNYSLDQTDGNLTLTIGTYTPSDHDTPDVPDIPDVPAVAEPVTPGASVEFNAESVTVDISVGYKVLNIAALTGKGVNIYAPRVDFGYSVGDAADNADKQTTDADKSVLVKAEKDDMLDLFLANATDVWSSKYVAKHTGTVDKWATGETVELDGKNKIADFFYGSDDDNILYLTDDTNGDGLFVDDIYSAIPGNDLKNTSRIENLKVIYAGSGDDIVDMTSEKMSYTGGGVIVYGGDDDDTIWANNGSNTLYGDAGNDRIVGASGNDLIIGGSGNDSMHGGGGEDTFCFGGEWGNDIVEQLDGGTVTLWFAEGSENNWHVDTFTYCDGENSVKVIGENLTVNFKFGSTDDAPTGAFDGFASEKIFEDKTNGNLA